MRNQRDFTLHAASLHFSFWASSRSSAHSSLDYQVMALECAPIFSALRVFNLDSLTFLGCWRRSAGAITATAILMLTACLLASGAMGLWHTVEFFEKEKVVGEEYFQQWPNVNIYFRVDTLSYRWASVDFARQHSHFVRLELYRSMGRCRMQTDCRNPSLRLGCLLAFRAREGRTTQPPVSHAGLPTEAGCLRLSTVSPTSLPWSLLRFTIRPSSRPLQLLKSHHTGTNEIFIIIFSVMISAN